jgi:predicted nucleic acid-binding protein
MRVGLDTNVLLRLFERDHEHHAAARAVVEGLIDGGDESFVSLQVLTELWNAMTRPSENNGLAWDTDTAAARIADTLSAHQFLPDTVEVAGLWLDLVTEHAVIGKKVHDASSRPGHWRTGSTSS